MYIRKVDGAVTLIPEWLYNDLARYHEAALRRNLYTGQRLNVFFFLPIRN